MIIKIVKRIFNFIFENIKLFLIKLIYIRNLKFNLCNFISFFTSINISRKGKISLGKWLKVYRGVTLSSIDKGILMIGNASFINCNCCISAHKKIVIGDNTLIGPNTVIFDHDHVYDKNGVRKKEFNCDDIIIGNNVWIGANCTILKGTKIRDNSVIGAGSVIKGVYPKGSVIIQERTDKIKNIK